MTISKLKDPLGLAIKREWVAERGVKSEILDTKQHNVNLNMDERKC